MKFITDSLSVFLLLTLLTLQTLATPLSPLVSYPRSPSKKLPPPPGKRGLPFTSTSVTNLQSFASKSSRITWAYDWSSTMDPSFPTNLEYVPMLWDTKQLRTLDWMGNVNKAIARGTKDILAFNEPDLPSQANMTTQEAVDAYLRYLQPFAGRVNLGGPAVTESPGGTAWLLEFLSKCSNCTIDFIPVHIYSTTSNIGHFQRHIQHIHNATGKPIWVTEFHASGDEKSQTSFLQAMMPWLDAQDYVLRYAWYKCSTNYLLGTLCATKGKVSKLGKVFEKFVG